MSGMFLADVLDSKIVDDKGELDGAPLVLPESRDNFALEVSVFAKAFFRVVLGLGGQLEEGRTCLP